MITIFNYINGNWADPASDQWIEDIDPSRGEVYARIPDSGQEDVARAVAAASRAQHAWGRTSLEVRHRFLRAIADRIEDRLDTLATAESRDNGKPVKLATAVDIPRASSNFRFFANALTQYASQSHAMAGHAINYTLRQPIGVVGCISPWNLPLYLFTWKIAPALAAGNTVVAKPSEITPMTAYLLSEICIECDLPPGVLNIVHGYGHRAGAAIVEHPKVKAISFTGGTKTGAEIARIAAPKFKKLSLELGGKNPNVIFADCDFDKMLATTMRSSFANQGQICLCGSRIYVEAPIYERFRDAFVQQTKKLVVGDPAEPSSQLGAVVSEAHMGKILSYIELAREEGGKVLAGGHQVTLPGDLA
ncbi:MAG: aldehyde dehydrogenase family protein, partial [Saprospiraceae bacterium]|nr:aldehyde dehydrogenase family protein [Saprospiraceae bacterium]